MQGDEHVQQVEIIQQMAAFDMRGCIAGLQQMQGTIAAGTHITQEGCLFEQTLQGNKETIAELYITAVSSPLACMHNQRCSLAGRTPAMLLLSLW